MQKEYFLLEGFIQQGLTKSSLARLPLGEKLKIIKQQIVLMAKKITETQNHEYRSSLIERIKKLRAAERRAEQMLQKGRNPNEVLAHSWQTTY